MIKNVKVTINFFDFAEHPETLATMFSLQIDQFTVKGEIPKGRRNPAKENSLTIESRKSESDDIDTHVLDILERVPPEICAVVGIGMIVRVTIYIPEGDSTPSCATFLTCETVKKLANLNCGLEFDIYGNG